MAVRAVVFDLFITLTDWEAERRRRVLEGELAAAMRVDPVALSALMRATFDERARGRFGDVRSTFVALAARLGCTLAGDHLDQVLALRFQHQRSVVVPRAGVMDVLARVRGDGYRTAILTDCTGELVDLWPSLPFAAVVDAVTFSCAMGVRKPDPACYRDVTAKLGVRPEDCVYVGDGGSSELTGAAATGMTAILLETQMEPEYRYDAEVGWTGLTIADLADLPGLLERFAAG